MIKALIEKTKWGLLCHRVGGIIVVDYPSRFKLTNSKMRVFEKKAFEIGKITLKGKTLTAYTMEGILLKTWDKEEILEVL